MARLRYVGPQEGVVLGHVEKEVARGDTVELDDERDADLIRGLLDNGEWEPVDEKRRGAKVTEGNDGDGA